MYGIGVADALFLKWETPCFCVPPKRSVVFDTHEKCKPNTYVLSMSHGKFKHCVLSKMNVIGLNYQSVNVLFYVCPQQGGIRHTHKIIVN